MLLICLLSVKNCFPSPTIIAHPDSQQSTYFPQSLINREIRSNGQFTLYMWINISATETQKIWIRTKQITNENAQLTKQMTNSTSSLILCDLCRCGESVINHNNNHNNHKATREMSKQQTINDVKNKQTGHFI